MRDLLGKVDTASYVAPHHRTIRTFLTDEWLSAIDAAAQRSPDLASVAATGALVIEQFVRERAGSIIAARCTRAARRNGHAARAS